MKKFRKKGVFAKTLPYFKNYMWGFWVGIVLSLLSTVAMLLMPQIPQLIIDRIINPALGEKAVYSDSNVFSFLLDGYAEDDYFGMLNVMLICMAVVCLVKYVTHYARWNITHNMMMRGENKVRDYAFYKMLRQSPVVLNRYTSGDMLNVTNNDPSAIKDLYLHHIPFLLGGLCVTRGILGRSRVLRLFLSGSRLVIHVDRHGGEHIAIYRVELCHVAGHLFDLFAVARAVVHRAFIHLAYVAQAHVHAVDVVELRADALQLYFIDGVQPGDVAVERFHLFDVALGVVGDAVAVVGDVAVGVEQEVRHVGERLGGLAELHHLFRDGGHLVEVFLGGVGKLGHAGNLVGGCREFLYAVGEVLGIFLAHVDVRGNAGDAPGIVARDDHAAVARDVSIDDDATAVTALEVGTVFGVFRGQHGEHLFPVVFFGRAVEGGEDKHQDLHAHAYREHDIAAREVQYLEEGTPNDDGGAYTVCKVEKSFSRVTREEFFDAVFISLVFSHNG